MGLNIIKWWKITILLKIQFFKRQSLTFKIIITLYFIATTFFFLFFYFYYFLLIVNIFFLFIFKIIRSTNLFFRRCKIMLLFIMDRRSFISYFSKWIRMKQLCKSLLWHRRVYILIIKAVSNILELLSHFFIYFAICIHLIWLSIKATC